MSDTDAHEAMKEIFETTSDSAKKTGNAALDTMNKASETAKEHAGAAVESMKSEGSTMLKLWRENANRMLRANERMMHGMMTALKLEFQLGQDLVERRMDTMRAAGDAGKAGEARQTAMERQMEEIERLVATMREVSEEMRASFGDATRLMFYDIEDDSEELAAAKLSAPVKTGV